MELVEQPSFQEQVRLTVSETLRKAKSTGVVIDNIDFNTVMAYITLYEGESKFVIKYNYKEGKTMIVGV